MKLCAWFVFFVTRQKTNWNRIYTYQLVHHSSMSLCTNFIFYLIWFFNSKDIFFLGKCISELKNSIFSNGGCWNFLVLCTNFSLFKHIPNPFSITKQCHSWCNSKLPPIGNPFMNHPIMEQFKSMLLSSDALPTP